MFVVVSKQIIIYCEEEHHLVQKQKLKKMAPF